MSMARCINNVDRVTYNIYARSDCKRNSNHKVIVHSTTIQLHVIAFGLKVGVMKLFRNNFRNNELLNKTGDE